LYTILFIEGESIAVAVVAALREVLPRLFVQFSPALSTGAASPVLAHGSSSSHLTAPEDMAPVTEYAAYSLTDIQLNRKYYNDAKRGINDFSSQEDKEQYGLHCSRSHIWVKYIPTNAVVYKCSVIGVAPRNFLLELHASGYIIHRWLERRRAGDFDSMNYEGSASPQERFL
jgi:hypothetical protein